MEITQIYKNMEESFSIKENDNLKDLVNFQNVNQAPFHRWFDYGEGFSPKLVKKKISENNVNFIFDPFVGGGTTVRKAAELGKESLGIEINPFSAFLARVKSRKYHKSDLEKIKKYVKEMEKVNFEPTIKEPELNTIKKMFKDKNGTNHLDKVLMYKEFIENIEEKKIRDVLKLGFLSILEKESNYRKGGNGLKKKYNPNRNIDRALFQEQYPKMMEDINNTIIWGENEQYIVPEIIEDDSKNMKGYLKKNSVDLSIFSPPYANCFDYCEIYKIELWFGGFVNSYEEMRKLKRKGVRSHVNIKRDYSDVSIVIEELSNLLEKMDENELWHKDIPKMIKGYFYDMKDILRELYHVMKQGGEVEIIVSNSSYGNVVFSTDLLLAKIAEDVGYEVKEINIARKMITSSQQYNSLGKLNEHMRESIVSLKKV